jgi:hypothetical protein
MLQADGNMAGHGVAPPATPQGGPTPATTTL